jgi:hypothetical protein
MPIESILRYVHKHPGFVYERVVWGGRMGDVLHVQVRPRAGSQAICSRCDTKGAGYDRLPERSFTFIPLWGIAVLLIYAMRRVDCPTGGEAVDDGGRHAALGAVPVEELAHSADRGRVARDGFGDGGIELGGGDRVEDGQQARGDVAEVASTLGGANHERLGVRNGTGESVERATAPGARLVLDERGHVSLVFDLLSAVPAARVGRDDAGAVEHAHGVEGRDHGQGAPDVCVWHGVVIEVEAHVGCLAYVDFDSLLAGERGVG